MAFQGEGEFFELRIANDIIDIPVTGTPIIPCIDGSEKVRLEQCSNESLLSPTSDENLPTLWGDIGVVDLLMLMLLVVGIEATSANRTSPWLFWVGALEMQNAGITTPMR